MLGQEGLTKSTEVAILNANYIKKELKDHYNILYTNPNDLVSRNDTRLSPIQRNWNRGYGHS